jgi:hypothetical protein
MKEIIKKCDKNIFEKIVSGQKKFEVRLGNFEGREGDLIILKECELGDGHETGREIRKRIGFTIKTKDMPWWSDEEKNKHGFVIMQLV